jgi:hypothetical protein
MGVSEQTLKRQLYSKYSWLQRELAYRWEKENKSKRGWDINQGLVCMVRRLDEVEIGS